jgi:hypothetical protein
MRNASHMPTDTRSPRHWSEWPPVQTQADLDRHWRELMGHLGFSETLLWMIFFDAAGQPTPLINQVADLPDQPRPASIANLLAFCADVISDAVPDGSVAFLRSRPGPAAWTSADRAWATQITQAEQRSPVRVHPVHLANDEELRVFTLDDLAATG